MADNSSNPPTTHSSTNGLDPNTTFVLADPESFRAVVQKLTGAAANIHERRPTGRKLNINLHKDNSGTGTGTAVLHSRSSFRERTALASPISPLDFAAAREEEERTIAAKGFYLLSTPAGSEAPELLPLFPLYSARENYDSSSF